MNIAVFCSANDNIDAEYFKRTEELGKRLAEGGHTLVFGGCNSGLMQCVAKAVKEAGGTTVGVIPTIIEQGRRQSEYVDVEIPCEDLTMRKAIMMERSDVFIALPGGIGTIDEVFSVAASATIGYHHKRVIMYNIGGFWNELKHTMEVLSERGFMRGDYTKYITFADELEDVLEKLRN